MIRVDADEVTYPAHIILRYEIERPLIEGEIEPEDIPALWDAKMQELLGLDTRGNYKDGPLQDVHWTDGAVRLLPLLFAGRDVRRAVVRGDAPRACPTSMRASPRGDLAPVFDWLRDNIWSRPAAGPPTNWPCAPAARR